MSDPPDFYNQAFNSRAVVFDKPTERSGQHHRSAAGGGLSEAMLAKNKEHSARSKGDRRLCFERAERLAKQDARARIV